MKTREQMQHRLHEILRNLRDSFSPVRCLAIHPAALQVIFGSQYACEKWAAEHQLNGVVITTRLPEGGAFFGGADVLEGRDDAIDAMLQEIERTQALASEEQRVTGRKANLILPDRFLQ